jgi:hypothetical protein
MLPSRCGVRGDEWTGSGAEVNEGAVWSLLGDFRAWRAHIAQGCFQPINFKQSPVKNGKEMT